MPTRKRADTVAEEMAPEYDFAQIGKPERGKYFERMKADSNLVLLDPDVSAAFPTADAVNDALRSLLEIANTVRASAPAPRRRKARSAR
jgi:hypothetical protein